MKISKTDMEHNQVVFNSIKEKCTLKDDEFGCKLKYHIETEKINCEKYGDCPLFVFVKNFAVTWKT